MIIANLAPNGICHTIYNAGNRVVELHSNCAEVPVYDEILYLRSHYNRETSEWSYCPSREHIWNEELQEFYLPEPPAVEVPPTEEEPPTEE